MISNAQFQRLEDNKKATLENIKNYLNINNKEIVETLVDGSLHNEASSIIKKALLTFHESRDYSQVILLLEEARDSVLGITWHYGQDIHQDGSSDLIRDARNAYVIEPILTQRAETISNIIAIIHNIRAAINILEIDCLTTQDDELAKSGATTVASTIESLAQEILHKLDEEFDHTSINFNKQLIIDVKKFNNRIIYSLKRAKAKQTSAKINALRSFLLLSDQYYHVTTITKNKNLENKSIYLIEVANMALGLEQEYISQYNAINQSDPNKKVVLYNHNGKKLNMKWYNKLPKYLKLITHKHAHILAQGNVLIPENIKPTLPYNNNGYIHLTYVYDNKVELILNNNSQYKHQPLNIKMEDYLKTIQNILEQKENQSTKSLYSTDNNLSLFISLLASNHAIQKYYNSIITKETNEENMLKYTTFNNKNTLLLITGGHAQFLSSVNSSICGSHGFSKKILEKKYRSSFSHLFTNTSQNISFNYRKNIIIDFILHYFISAFKMAFPFSFIKKIFYKSKVEKFKANKEGLVFSY